MTYRIIRAGLLTVATASWVTVTLLHTLAYTAAAESNASGHAQLVCKMIATPSTSGVSHLAAIGSDIGTNILMTLAMMVPACLPAVRFVVVNTFKAKRAASVLVFIGSFMLVWTLWALAIVIVVGMADTLASPLLPTTLLPITLGLAALWQVTPIKRAAMRACHSGPTLPVSGWRAAAALVHFGLRYGSNCVTSCWLLMAATYAAGHAMLLWMVALSAVIWFERTRPRTRSLFRGTAAGLGALALVALTI